ncbi:MAG: hypothetical protein WKF41_12880 [Gaiellaceae bacterium]
MAQSVQEPDAYESIALVVGELMNKNLRDVLTALSDPSTFKRSVESAGESAGELSGMSDDEVGEALKNFWAEFGGCRIALDFSSISGRPSRESQRGYQIQPYNPPGAEFRLPGWPKEIGVGVRIRF